jgi:hypothetical protein
MQSPFTDGEEKKIVEQVVEEKAASENDTYQLRENIKEQWRLYNGFRTQKRTLSKLICGLPFAFVENGTAALFKEVLGITEDNLVSVYPANSSTPLENAFKMKVLINNQMCRTKFRRKILDHIQQGMIAGTAPWKAPMVTDVKYLFERNSFWEALAPSNWFKDTKEVCKRSQSPEFNPIDIFNFFPAPLLSSFETDKMEYIIDEEWLPLNYFEDRKDNSFFNIGEGIEENQINEKVGDKGWKDSLGTIKRVRYWERWGTFKHDGKTREYVIGIANKNTLVRFNRNVFYKQRKPYGMGSNFSMPFSPWGRGENEPIKNNIYQLDDLTNSIQDNINTLVHAAFTVLQGSPLANRERLFTEPGGLFVVRNHNDIQPLINQRNDIVQSALWMVNKLQNDAQFTIGASDFSMGITPDRKEAVGVVAAVQRVSAVKYAKKMYLLLQTTGEETARFFGDYNQQFVTEPVYVPYGGMVDKAMLASTGAEEISPGKYEFEISPKDLQGEFIYVFNVDLMKLQEEVLRQQLQSLYMFLEQNGVVGLDLGLMLKEILHSYPIRNLDKIVSPTVLTSTEIKQTLITLSEAGYKIMDPKGNIIGEPLTGQNGGRPAEGFNPRKAPAATDEAGVRKGVMQTGQENPGRQGGQ